ncbi:hypothetical protein XAC2852_790195 [Xanthomonas citri pv. citri]|nr:hypothetical protein XAC2852_790195 [Xanthomonas citri pv. citri]
MQLHPSGLTLDIAGGGTGARACTQVCTSDAVQFGIGEQAFGHGIQCRGLRGIQRNRGRAVATIDGGLRFAVCNHLPLFAGIPRADHVALALRGVVVLVGEARVARQLARREIRLDRVQGFFERLLVRHFARHQKTQRIHDARIVGDVDQALIHQLGTRFGRDIGAHVGRGAADAVDIRRRPRHAAGIDQGRATAIQNLLGMAGAVLGHVAHLHGFFHALGEHCFGPLVEHGDDRADDFEMADLFGGDVEQQILAARVVLAQCLGEVAHCSGKFALRSAELFQHQRRQIRIGLGDADGVHQTLVVHEHGWCSMAGARQLRPLRERAETWGFGFRGDARRDMQATQDGGAVLRGDSGGLAGLGCLLVAALLGEQGQLFVGGLFFFQRGEQQRQCIGITELLGYGGNGAVRGDFVMLHLLRTADQCRIAHRAGLDFIDDLAALLHQAFHRSAFDALELDAQNLDDLVDAFDLALGFFQMSFEGLLQFRLGGRTRKTRQRLGQLLLGAVDVRQLVDEKVFDSLDRHVWLLWLVRGWGAAVRHVGGNALMSSRCTPANKRADASRTTTSKTPRCVSLARRAGL